jgi:hypothetical protein
MYKIEVFMSPSKINEDGEENNSGFFEWEESPSKA